MIKLFYFIFKSWDNQENTDHLFDLMKVKMDDPDYDRLSIKMATAKANACNKNDDQNSSIESLGSDNSQQESVDGGDMASSSLTAFRNQNKSVRKKGRKHKLKLMCSSPIDVTISVPIEINNISTSSSLRNDTGSTRSLRSLSDSWSDEYTMDEIECDFRQLINKHSSTSHTLKEEDLQQEQQQQHHHDEEHEVIESLESPIPNGYERRITVTLSADDLGDELIVETSEQSPNRERRASLKLITSLPTLEETASDESHSEEHDEETIVPQDNSSKENVILSPIEEVSVVESEIQNLPIRTDKNQTDKQDLSILDKYNLTEVQHNLIKRFFLDHSQDGYLNALFIKKLLSACFQQRDDVRLTDSDVNRIVYVADRDSDGKLSLRDFVEMLCLCFAKKNDLNSYLMTILANRSYGNETQQTGFLEAHDANDFVSYVNKFYGRQFYFMSFFETISYEDLALDLSEDLHSAIFF